METSISNTKPYLLDPNFLVDSPMPVFKSLTELVQENIWWILCIFIIFILCGLFYFFKKKKSKEVISNQAPVPVDPFTEAIQQLDKLESTSPRPAAKPFIFRLSEILRLYVEKQFNLPALECTGEEFIRKVAVHPFLRKKFEVPLKNFVSKGDHIKYSTDQSDAKVLEELLLSARKFIEQAQHELDVQRQKLQGNLNSKTSLPQK